MSSNLVATVFKVLGIFLVLMVIMQVSIIIIDNVSSNKRAERVQSYALEVLMDNNAIPAAVKPEIERDLNSIVTNSSIITGYEWNYDKSVTYNGVTYPPVGESYVKGYGERAELVILLHKETSLIGFWLSSGGNGTQYGRLKMTSTTPYIDSVPTLRYLK